MRRADLAALHAMWISPGVRRFLWDDEVIPPERTVEIIEQSVELFATRGFGLWGAWDRRDSVIVGFGALWFFRDPPELELRYGVAEHRWRRGYASEIARARHRVRGHIVELL